MIWELKNEYLQNRMLEFIYFHGSSLFFLKFLFLPIFLSPWPLIKEAESNLKDTWNLTYLKFPLKYLNIP